MENNNEETKELPKEERKQLIEEEWKTEFGRKSKIKLVVKTLLVTACLLIVAGAIYIAYQNYLKDYINDKLNNSENNNDNVPNNDFNSENLFNITPNGTASKLYIACNKESDNCFVENTNDNQNSIVKATYNCTNSSCKGFDVAKKYATIYDGDYYVYDYVANKAAKLDLGTQQDIKTLRVVANDNNIYGIIVETDFDNNGIKKSAFYSLEKGKYTIDFSENYNDIYAKSTLFDSDFSPALEKGYIFANTKTVNENYKYTSYIIEMSTGKVIFTTKDVSLIEAVKKNQTMYYLAYEYLNETSNSVKFYNSNLEPLFTSVNYKNYSIKDNGNVILANDKSFGEYNPSGALVKNSREFKKVEQLINDFVVVVDNDNYLKLVDHSGNEVAKFVEMTDNLYLHTALSGYYEAENKPQGIYLVVEDKTKIKSNGGRVGNEYYYDTKNKKTGVFENVPIGGYAKPVLYLYPKVKTNVTVTFEKPNLLTTTYPKFNNSWVVTAHPNGDLYDKNGNYYYALYWEEKGSNDIDFKTGFYVTKDNAIKFLEEKLTIIGLNSRERNEFIMYWLPILEKNEKNLVYFELTEERNSYNKLIINPTPDSLLRLAIHIKKVDKEISIKEQKLTSFNRTGFTAIEWGGVIH